MSKGDTASLDPPFEYSIYMNKILKIVIKLRSLFNMHWFPKFKLQCVFLFSFCGHNL